MKIEFTENYSLALRENIFFLLAKLRQNILTMAHQGHLGVSKTKSLMRETVYWQGMDEEVEKLLNEYMNCQANKKLPNPAPAKISESSKVPWAR